MFNCYFLFFIPFLSHCCYHCRFIGEFMCILWYWHFRFCILVHSSWSQWPQVFSWLNMLITSMVYMIDKIVIFIASYLQLKWANLLCELYYRERFPIFLRRAYLCEWCKLCFFVIYVLLKLDFLFCIVLVCSEPQVFKYEEYLKSLFYNHILKCYSNKINETRCNSLLPMCKGSCKKCEAAH